jgi:hypothetical protein
MARFETLGFGNARNVGMACLCAVAGLAEDLKVMGFICAAKSQGQNVINVPSLAGIYLLRAGSTKPLPNEEQI